MCAAKIIAELVCVCAPMPIAARANVRREGYIDAGKCAPSRVTEQSHSGASPMRSANGTDAQSQSL